MANANFGLSVSSAGDFNNDGYSDIIIGTSDEASFKGSAYVIYGGPKSSMPNIDLSTTTLDPQTTGFKITGTDEDILGTSVSSAGDINKDGYNDIIIAASYGGVFVIYGGPKSSMSNINLSTTPLDPLTTGFEMRRGNSIRVGNQVRSAGDINKDGYADVIIGSYGEEENRGAAYVVYGGPKSRMSNIDLSTTPLNPLSTGFQITGEAEWNWLGSSVGSAGDINKDGYDDVIIGAWLDHTLEGGGAVHVVYGGPKSRMSNIALSTTTLNPLTTGISIFGSHMYDQLGWSVSAADINNDGNPDFIFGTLEGQNNEGAVYLVLNQCPKGCMSCSSAFTCNVCSQGYALENSLCHQCPTNCETCTASSYCDICSAPYALSSGQCEVEEKEIEKVAVAVFEGTSLVGAALGSGSSLPLNFGLATRILRNFRYMKITVSQELYETFVSWKVGFLNAPDSWSLKYSSKGLPEVFSLYELQSAFLMNFWRPLVLTLIGIAVFGVFKLIEVNIKNKKGIMCNLSKQVNVAGSNFALIQFYGNLDDLILYFTLEMRSTNFETGFRICSSVLAIVLLFVGVVFLVLHSVMLRKYQRLKEVENISLIFKDFKDQNLLIQSFLMVNLIRSVLSSLIFVTLFEYPIVQISLLLALNILMIVYLCWKRSFKELFNTLGQIFCEVTLLVAHICVLILAILDQNESSSNSIENLSKCIIIINFILLFGCAALLIVNLGKMLYKSFVERRKAQQILSQDNNVFASAKFNRPGQELDQSHPNLSESNGGLMNQSQSILQSDPIPSKTAANDNIEKNLTSQQGISDNSLIQERTDNQNPTDDLNRSSLNVENSEDPNRSNIISSSMLSHSHTQELAFSRIAQGSKMREKFRKKYAKKQKYSFV